MNLTDIKVQPCSLMDDYDLAMKELHNAIIVKAAGIRDGKLTREELAEITQLQAATLVIRNQIANKLIDLSWLSVPEDQRR